MPFPCEKFSYIEECVHTTAKVDEVCVMGVTWCDWVKGAPRVEKSILYNAQASKVRGRIVYSVARDMYTAQ